MRGMMHWWTQAATGLRTIALALCLLHGPVALAAPVQIGGSYIADGFANIDGGRKRGTAYLGLAELTIEADGGAVGLAGTTLHAAINHAHGRPLSAELVGDGQAVSNIEALPALRLFEAWVSTPLAPGVDAKAGLVDLNSEFDVQPVGGLFLHSSHGIGADFAQSGLNGPSIYPATSLALIGRFSRDGWIGRIGVFDAVAGHPGHPGRPVLRLPPHRGVLLVAEAEHALPGHIIAKVGAWGYTSHFHAIMAGTAGAPISTRGSRGVYASVQGQLAGAPGEAVLDGWVRAGIATARINPVGCYLGGGVTYGTDVARVGAAVAHARLGDPAMRAAVGSGIHPRRAETSIELTYARRMTRWLTVQPDVQYVIDPGWRGDRRDALVAGLRLIVSLS
ncbi:hypothetical protein KC8_09385 [Sphingomonas sp. KC8]|nr:hypothetical protein KC8_09385 [Sphingomonas sp. KC8]